MKALVLAVGLAVLTAVGVSCKTVQYGLIEGQDRDAETIAFRTPHGTRLMPNPMRGFDHQQAAELINEGTPFTTVSSCPAGKEVKTRFNQK